MCEELVKQICVRGVCPTYSLDVALVHSTVMGKQVAEGHGLNVPVSGRTEATMWSEPK